MLVAQPAQIDNSLNPRRASCLTKVLGTQPILILNDVTVTGWVPDLRPLYDRARVVVAPLRYGAGVKGKIGEALSRGLPTVTTSIGIEGIGLCPGIDILVGDIPELFADLVAEAYSSEVRWTELRANGSEAIERQFGWAATEQRIDQLLETVALVDPRLGKN